MKKFIFYSTLLFITTIAPRLTFSQSILAPQPEQKTWVPVWQFNNYASSNSSSCLGFITNGERHQNGSILNLYGGSSIVKTFNKKATAIIQTDSCDMQMSVNQNGAFQPSPITNFVNCGEAITAKVVNSSGTFILKFDPATSRMYLYKDSLGVFVPVLFPTPIQDIYSIKDYGNGTLLISGRFNPTAFGLPISAWNNYTNMTFFSGNRNTYIVTYDPISNIVIPWDITGNPIEVPCFDQTTSNSDTFAVTQGIPGGGGSHLKFIKKNFNNFITIDPDSTLTASYVEKPLFFSKNNVYAHVALGYDSIRFQHFDGVSWSNVPGFPTLEVSGNLNPRQDYDPVTQTLWTDYVHIHIPTGVITVNTWTNGYATEADDYFGLYWNNIRYTFKQVWWLGKAALYLGTFRDITPPTAPNIVTPINNQIFIDTTTQIYVSGDSTYFGDTIKIYSNGVLLGTTVSDSFGNWGTYINGLMQTYYILKISRTDPSGNEGPLKNVEFSIKLPNNITSNYLNNNSSCISLQNGIATNSDNILNKIIVIDILGNILFENIVNGKFYLIPIEKRNQVLYVKLFNKYGFITKKVIH
jgi:hypothetical protein